MIDPAVEKIAAGVSANLLEMACGKLRAILDGPGTDAAKIAKVEEFVKTTAIGVARLRREAG